MTERVLFVLSRDYGELFNAAYFAHGTGLDATFAMPGPMHALNHASFPYKSLRYSRLCDLIDALERERPQTVCLFSGYLYVLNGIFGDLSALDALIARACTGDQRLATSDPFLGLQRRTSDEKASGPMRAIAHHLARASETLSQVTHLYVASDTTGGTKGTLSYYNARAVLGLEQTCRIRAAVAGWKGFCASRRRWVFILATDDYVAQCRILGGRTFTQGLLRMLEATIAAGRQPILIAPRACILAVENATSNLSGLRALSACAYTTFAALLHDAEYAFYWNRFSATILARVLNLQPFFVFDKGHLARVLNGFEAAADERYYPNGGPHPLEHGEWLDPDRLGERARAERAGMLPQLRAHLERSSDPLRVLQELRPCAT